MDDTPPPPRANKLLAAISSESYARLAPYLESVYLRRGQTLYRNTGPVRCLHFPTTAIISVFSGTPTGASAEVALIGNDATLGIMAVLCGVRAPFRTTIDTAGHAYRINHRFVHMELARRGSLQRVLMRHLTARMTHIAGNAVCNSQHSVEQRLCRALLMRLERARDSSLLITQETMATILGVRRPAVTTAAAALKKAGIVTYKRGHVDVVDRRALQERACECYAAIKEQIECLSRL